MKPFDLIPSPADFAHALANFDSWLLGVPVDRRSRWSYVTYFRDAGQAAEDAGNSALAMANDILCSVCFYPTSYDSANKPLGQGVAIIRRNYEKGKDSFDGILFPDGSQDSQFEPVARLRWEHYDVLESIYSSIADVSLRARVADLLWLARGEHKAAIVATDAYLLKSQNRSDGGWVHAFPALQRAMRIERGLNIKNGPALKHAETELQQYTAGDSTYHSAYLMSTMFDLKIGNPTLCGSLAESSAQVAESTSDWDRAERYWNLAVDWYSRAKNQSAKESALWSLVRCYEKHADFVLCRDRQCMPHFHAAHWMQRAVETLRGMPGSVAKAESEKLYARLVAFQSRIMGEMPVSFHPVDISDLVEAAQKSVTGHPLIEALGILAVSRQPPPPISICKDSYAISRQAVFLARSAQTQLCPTGGTAAKNTLPSEDEKLQKRELRRVRMIQHAHLQQELATQGTIIPALQTIGSEHHMTSQSFMPMLKECLFVLKGHEAIFARGLIEGARGDWLLSSHLLVPQIEAGFRVLLFKLGATPPDDVKNGKREWGMQEFLLDEDCCAGLATVFGEPLLYDARVLLVEKFGSNLRPNIAHGLLPQSVSASPYVNSLIYVWWLALRLCVETLRFQASLSLSTDEPTAA